MRWLSRVVGSVAAAWAFSGGGVAAGAPLVYSTYLGGATGSELVSDVATDRAGNVYLTGFTSSVDFPTTPGAFQREHADGGLWTDAFVVKLNAAGGLVYSTYLGGFGRDEPAGIAVDASGSAYIAGATFSNYPTTPGSFQPEHAGGLWDGFVTKLSPDGSSLVYSSFIGGSIDPGGGESAGHDGADDVAVDLRGNAYVVAHTRSSDFPVRNAFQPAYGGASDNSVTKIDPDGSSILYSSYLGGSEAEATARVAADGAGNAYVTGSTVSLDFPTTPGSLRPLAPEGLNAFVTKVAPGGDVAYSTYLGGEGSDAGSDVAVDLAGRAHVLGSAGSLFPTTPGALKPICSSDVFVAKLNAAGSALDYATCFGGAADESAGGLALDSSGNAHVSGLTVSDDMPTTPDAVQRSLAASADAFLAKLDPSGTTLVHSTYLGGENLDQAGAVGVDRSGDAYVAGWTWSAHFPTTANAFQPTFSGAPTDGFVARVPLGVAAASVAMELSGPAELTVAEDRYSPNPFEVTGIARNDGRAEAHGVEATLYLPDGLALAGGSATQQVGTLAPGEERRLMWSVRATGASENETLRYFLAGSAANVTDIAPVGGQVAVPGLFTVSGVTPDRGGAGATVTVEIAGSRFAEEAQVTVGGRAVEQVQVVSAELIRATVALAGLPQGRSDVEVTNPGGDSRTLAGGFTLEPWRGAQIDVDIVGPERFRPGRRTTMNLTYSNSGNTDAVGVPVWLEGIPLAATVTLGRSPVRLVEPELEQPATFVVDGEQHVGLLLLVIPAGASGSIPVHITLPPDQGAFTLRAQSGTCMFQSPIDPSWVKCFESFFGAVLPGWIGDQFPPGCYGELAEIATTIGLQIEQKLRQRSRPLGPVSLDEAFGELTDLYIDLAQEVAGLAKQCAPALLTEAIKSVVPYLRVAEWLLVLRACLPALKSAYGDYVEKYLIPALAYDPNDKLGAVGAGPERYRSGAGPLPYTVLFENKPDATAPAQEVVITDQLDRNTLDLDSFELGAIAFGDRYISVPAGRRQFSTDVDLRPRNNLKVRINAGLDAGTGVVTWRFAALDPTTELPPEDPLAGFLPPNITSPEGEGSVAFTIEPKPGLATGTEIRNSARIVFDINAPIDTPAWRTTIDATAPTLALTGGGPTTAQDVTISAEARDDHSGVATYHWRLDGQRSDVTSPTLSLRRTSPGDVTVAATVTDRAGNQTSAETRVTFSTPNPGGVTPSSGGVTPSSGGGQRSPSPSNAFLFRRRPRVARDSSVRLTVRVPGPGTLSAVATTRGRPRPSTIARTRARATRAGNVALKLAPSRRAKALLRRRGQLAVVVKVTYSPTGGSPSSKTARLTMRHSRRADGTDKPVAARESARALGELHERALGVSIGKGVQRFARARQARRARGRESQSRAVRPSGDGLRRT